MHKHTYVVGSNGFIGTNIVNYYKKNKYSKIICIKKSDFNLLKESSVPRLEKKIKNNSLIIICTGIKKQLGDSLDIYFYNVLIIRNLLKSLINKDNIKIIFISSASVYGEEFQHKKKINENTDIKLNTYYGCSKYTSELLIIKFCENKDFKLAILRPALIYGLNDSSKGYGPTKFFFNFTENKPFSIWGDGSEYREFIYIEDLSKIIRKLSLIKFNGILNIASGKSYNYINVIKSLEVLFNIKLQYIKRPRSKKKVNHNFSNNKIRKLIPKFKFTSLDEGLELMKKIYRKN